MKDPIGDRMKHQYEDRTRYYLPRRSYSIIRCDGRSFHAYTRGLDRPFDQKLMDDMTATARYLCEEIAGAVLAYTQSDEISLLLTDFESVKTEAWFDGNLSKIVSLSAAMATAKFNELRPGKLAVFDSRAFTIPDPVEVQNYLRWRQQDATRNSVSMTAQSRFSHKQLHGKSSSEMQEMLWQQHGINWNDMPDPFKRGTLIHKVEKLAPVIYTDHRTSELVITKPVMRRVWTERPAPIFTQDPILDDLIPILGQPRRRPPRQEPAA